MSWYKFWTIGERAFDRFTTIAMTLAILRIGGYLHISWWYIGYWAVFSLLGIIVMTVPVALSKPSEKTVL